jgi:hypothetical protein
MVGLFLFLFALLIIPGSMLGNSWKEWKDAGKPPRKK